VHLCEIPRCSRRCLIFWPWACTRPPQWPGDERLRRQRLPLLPSGTGGSLSR
jgi:hypothetical protein